ncbi:hypothetical protein K2Z84_05500 [Candidatus Binatia bacterium]|nr:hypothetical protein [Candidatus Binatia bacterium]
MLRILAPAALLVAALTGTAYAQFTCSTVARAGQLDPDGLVYGNVFREEVAVNAAGDAVFVARANASRDKLYFYPSAGAGQVVARADGPAPNGGTFRSQRAFFSLSLNDADDVAFYAELVSGQGVFVRDGGVLETAAVRSQSSPAGGVFDAFPVVGDIDAASRVPFVATVDGGPGGVFVYDSTSNAVSTLVLDGAATLDGREVCSTQAVDLGDTGAAVLRATSKTSCSNAAESARSGLFLVTLGGISTLVLDGDPSPIGGSSYGKFLDTPRINAGNEIAFRATTTGTTRTDAIFLRAFPSGVVTLVEREGDASPVGGSFGANQSFRFADSGNVLLNAKLRSSSAKFGVFDLGLVDSAAIVKTSAPPTDAFGVGSSYTRFSRVNGASGDGFKIGLQVRVRDTNLPSAKGGVVRCAGSASGAFLDDDVFY